MCIYKKYEYEFNQLVYTVKRTHQGHGVYNNLWYVQALHKSLKKVYKKQHNQMPLLKEDIEQELRTLWLEYVKLWELNKPPVKLGTYLLRRSVWGLRDWVSSQVRFVTESPEYTCEKDFAVHIIGIDRPDDLFKIDIGFLLHGCSMFPISELSPYERYLILLNFKEEKNILEIARTVQKDRGLVGRQLKAVIEKLRRLAKCQQQHSRI